HQRLKRAWTLIAERAQQSDDGVPGDVAFGRARADDVAADRAFNVVGGRRPVPLALVVALRDRLEDPGVEQPGGTGGAGPRKALVHGRDDARGHGFAFFHQRFDPVAEPRDVEPFGAAGGGWTPEVEVEDGRDLLRRRRRDERAAGFDAVVTDDLVQDVGREARNDLR